MKKTMSGYLTIEASIVVPTVLIIVATILIASLLIHDIYVIKTNNSMKVDASVIGGEDTRLNQGVATFIIQPTYEITKSKGLFGNGYEASVRGGQIINPFGLEFISDETRAYTVKSPKNLIRTVDFVDDATDLWSKSREVKATIEDQLTSIEDLLLP